MFGLRVVSVAVAAILFGAASAVPPPPPPAHAWAPRVGEIVHVAPEHTSLSGIGTGNAIPHPGIFLGVDHHQNGIVAPITHNANTHHLKPNMPVPNEHGLTGVVRLDHIVAHRSRVLRSYGHLRDKRVSPAAVQRIQESKALVQAHYSAANAHGLAAQAHRGHEAHNDGLSAHHFQNNDPTSGAYHASQAAIHRGHAENHESAAAKHSAAARAVNGPNPAELQHAQTSAQYAHGVHQSFTAAAKHHANAATWAAHGNHQAAHDETQLGHNAHNSAMSNSGPAVDWANYATQHIQH